MEDRAEATQAEHPKVIYIDPSQALVSWYALQKNPTSFQVVGDASMGCSPITYLTRIVPSVNI